MFSAIFHHGTGYLHGTPLSIGQTSRRLKPEVLRVHIAAIVQFCDHRVGEALPAEVAHGTAAWRFRRCGKRNDPKTEFLDWSPKRSKN